MTYPDIIDSAASQVPDLWTNQRGQQQCAVGAADVSMRCVRNERISALCAQRAYSALCAQVCATNVSVRMNVSVCCVRNERVSALCAQRTYQCAACANV